jgi:UDP-glucose 4-epimerase
MTVLLTGGAGYIGSHMAARLLAREIDFVVVDNLSNSDMSNLRALQLYFKKEIKFVQSDIRDKSIMETIFDTNEIESVIHFAGLKSVNESVNEPNLYHDNNVFGAKCLLDLISKYDVKKFIFSSSATVYGEPKYLPIDEEHPLNAMSPYGQNKIDIENLILDNHFFDTRCCTKILRYFNPVGAYKHGLIGEIPKGIPNNLMPYLLGVVNGTYPHLQVFGDDYNTNDGTPIRDYIHVMDLVEAHLIALQDNKLGIDIYNVGNGNGVSVMEMINNFKAVNKIEVPYKIMPRREGDVESCYANNKKIGDNLNWSAKHNIRDICKDAYLFSQQLKK